MATILSILFVIFFFWFIFSKYPIIPIIITVAIVVAIIVNKHQKKKEKEEKERQEQARQKEIARAQEIMRKEEWERKIKESERQQQKRKEFASELNAIPECDYAVLLSQYVVQKHSLYEIPDISFTGLRANTNTFKAGNYVVIDVETTGLKPACDEIIELSAILFEDYEPIKKFDRYVKPRNPVPFEATAINNITNEQLADCQSIEEILPLFVDFCGQFNLVGHNLEFDLRFLWCAGYDFTNKKRKYYDTLSICKKHLKRDDDVDNYKLKTICEYYDIYIDNAHNSLSDSYATGRVFSRLVNEICKFD